MNKNLFLPVIFFCILWSSCGTKTVEPVKTVSEIYLTDSLLQVVTIDTVRITPLKDELLLNGRVDFHPEQVAYVYPMFGGVITDVRVEAGDQVRKGDILAVIRSGEVAELEKEKVEAIQQLSVVRRNLEVTQDMYNGGMASELELLAARQELATAESEVKRLDEIFEINRITGSSFYSIVSPVSGFVVEKNINRDMMIRPDQGDALFTISGLEEVLVTADVYESDITKVYQDAPVRIITLAYKDKEFTGVVDRISHILDSESKTMSIRVKLKNKDLLLKPGLFANVFVQMKGEGKEMTRVPSRAVIFEDGKYYVVRVGEGRILERKEVIPYKQLEPYCYMQEGVMDGDIIIHTNAILVYNALK